MPSGGDDSRGGDGGAVDGGNYGGGGGGTSSSDRSGSGTSSSSSSGNDSGRGDFDSFSGGDSMGEFGGLEGTYSDYDYGGGQNKDTNKSDTTTAPGGRESAPSDNDGWDPFSSVSIANQTPGMTFDIDVNNTFGVISGTLSTAANVDLDFDLGNNTFSRSVTTTTPDISNMTVAGLGLSPDVNRSYDPETNTYSMDYDTQQGFTQGNGVTHAELGRYNDIASSLGYSTLSATDVMTAAVNTFNPGAMVAQIDNIVSNANVFADTITGLFSNPNDMATTAIGNVTMTTAVNIVDISNTLTQSSQNIAQRAADFEALAGLANAANMVSPNTVSSIAGNLSIGRNISVENLHGPNQALADNLTVAAAYDMATTLGLNPSNQVFAAELHSSIDLNANVADVFSGIVGKHGNVFAGGVPAVSMAAVVGTLGKYSTVVGVDALDGFGAVMDHMASIGVTSIDPADLPSEVAAELASNGRFNDQKEIENLTAAVNDFVGKHGYAPQVATVYGAYHDAYFEAASNIATATTGRAPAGYYSDLETGGLSRSVAGTNSLSNPVEQSNNVTSANLGAIADSRNDIEAALGNFDPTTTSPDTLGRNVESLGKAVETLSQEMEARAAGGHLSTEQVASAMGISAQDYAAFENAGGMDFIQMSDEAIMESILHLEALARLNEIALTANVASGLEGMTSDEAIIEARRIITEETIGQYYIDTLGREATAEELEASIELVTSGEMSLGDIRVQIERSEESVRVNVTALYNEFIGQEPDADQLAHWVNEITSGNTKFSDLRHLVETSRDIITHQVESIFNQYAQDHVDDIDMNSWADQVMSKNISIQDLETMFQNTAEALGSTIEALFQLNNVEDVTQNNLDVFVHDLKNNALTMDQIAMNVAISDEAIENSISDLYDTLGDDQNVADDLDAWMHSIQNRSVNFGQAAFAVAISGERIDESLSTVHEERTGQDIEQNTLDVMSQSVQNGRQSEMVLQAHIAISEDALSHNITDVYQDVFGTDPSPQEINSWLHGLRNSDLTIDQIRDSLTRAAGDEGFDGFDTAYYLANNPDVAIAIANGDFESAYQHYNAHGEDEGRATSADEFDARFYLANNPDVELAVARGEFANAYEHFLRHGLQEERSAVGEEGEDVVLQSDTFDELLYIANNPDVAIAIANGDFKSAYDHYLQYGSDEGRAANNDEFDAAFYMANNPDVELAVVSGEFATAHDHYLAHGRDEGRAAVAEDGADIVLAAVDFDELYYLANNPHVTEAIANGEFKGAYHHYLAHGRDEGRAANSDEFDARFYLANNPDVELAVVSGEIASAQDHYLLHGRDEGRAAVAEEGVDVVLQSDSFDDIFYLANNPDVAAAIAEGGFNSAYDHYLQNGKDEGRAANSDEFDAAFYLANNADVASAVATGEFANAYDHYLQYGKDEGREAVAPEGVELQIAADDFDETYYLTHNQDVAIAIANGDFNSAEQHYELHGRDEGRYTSQNEAVTAEQQYLANNPDVAEAVANGEFTSGLEHFQTYGGSEGRSYTGQTHTEMEVGDAPQLDVPETAVGDAPHLPETVVGDPPQLPDTTPVLSAEEQYLADNPDVAAAVARGEFTSGLQHFENHGGSEGRSYSGQTYSAPEPAVTIHHVVNVAPPVVYIPPSPPVVVVQPTLSAEQQYLANNPDVAAAVARGEFTSGLEHFQRHGSGEGRSFQSPLVLDLDGDGVELTHVSHGAVFDIDNDGVGERTGWAASDDGLLALDNNHDGIINDQSELFGNNDMYADGFSKLAGHDENKDGVIDEKDSVFDDLVVWQDKNQDGISDQDEMYGLTDLDIVSIDLDAETPQDMYIEENWISHTSTFETSDGEKHEMVDAWFQYEEQTAQTSDDENALDLANLLDQMQGDPITQAIGDFVQSTANEKPVSQDSGSGVPDTQSYGHAAGHGADVANMMDDTQAINADLF